MNCLSQETATLTFENGMPSSQEMQGQLCHETDRLLELFQADVLDAHRIQFIVSRLGSLIQLMAGMETRFAARKVNANTLARVARTQLTDERYQKLELVCLEALGHADWHIRVQAMSILASVLGSEVGKPYMAQRLSASLDALANDGSIDVPPEELFATAESLAYLGDRSGLEVLESVLRSNGSPTGLKRRAIKAFRHLGSPIPEHLYLSEDAAVAYDAFGCIETPVKDKTILSYAVRQLERLHSIFQENHGLEHNQLALMFRLAIILKLGVRDGLVTGEELHAAKLAARSFAGSSDTMVRERISPFFAEIADDSDLGCITQMLSSPSAKIRAEATLALARCSPQSILSNARRLFELLDDADYWNRNFALYALRKGLGENTGNIVSDPEFKAQKERVRQEYVDRGFIFGD